MQKPYIVVSNYAHTNKCPLFIYIWDVQLKVTKSTALIEDLVTFACYRLKNTLGFPLFVLISINVFLLWKPKRPNRYFLVAGFHLWYFDFFIETKQRTNTKFPYPTAMGRRPRKFSFSKRENLPSKFRLLSFQRQISDKWWTKYFPSRIFDGVSQPNRRHKFGLPSVGESIAIGRSMVGFE